jgi:hypothetical protein
MLYTLAPHDWLWFVVGTLAVWRVTVLVCFDAGPFELLTALRRLFYRLHLGSLVDCFDCTALWVGAGFVLLMYRPTLISFLLLLGMAGGASLLERFFAPDADSGGTEERHD